MALNFADHFIGGVFPGQGFQQGLVGGVDDQDQPGLIIVLEVLLYAEGCSQQAGLPGAVFVGYVQCEKENRLGRHGFSDFVENGHQCFAGTAPVGVYLNYVQSGRAFAFYFDSACKGGG